MSYEVKPGLYPGELKVVRAADGVGQFLTRRAAAKHVVELCTAMQTRLAMSKAEARRLLKEGKAARDDRRKELTP